MNITTLFTTKDYMGFRDTIYRVETEKGVVYIRECIHEDENGTPTFEVLLRKTDEEHAKEVLNADLVSFIHAVNKGEEDSHPLSQAHTERIRQSTPRERGN
jgi:hypothetical protein